MSEPGAANRISYPFWWFACCVGLPLLALLLLGQDGNWDLRNYHLYNPHAWWQGRLATDVAPAQLQTWHNPLLDIPLYLLVRTGQPGWLVGLWLTLPTMLALYLVLRMQQALSPAGLSRLAILVATLLTISGAAAWSELGGSFNDAFVAAALLVALHRLSRTSATGPRDWLLAGLVAGAIAGLKLTAATYCLGLAVAALFCAPITRAPSRLGALLAGGLVGFALGYGYWGWHLQQSYGNPVFPYFNQLFHSPDALPEAYADRRFAPTGLFDGLMAPVHLAAGTQRHSEMFLRDPRLLLGLAAFIAAWWTSRARAPNTTARWRLLTLFYVASLLLWAFQYGIYRYALPLEMLAALPLVWLARQWPPRSAAVALCLMLLLVSVGTRRPDWSRQSFATPALRIDLPPLPANSLVVLSSREPLAFATLALAADVPMISVYNNFMQPDRCTGLQAEAESRIRNHQGPMWLLRTPSPQDDEGARIAERAYGLVDQGVCLAVPTTLGDLQLCPLQRRLFGPICHASRSP
jgi:hypothetical protein